jgi:hypothetical protein
MEKIGGADLLVRLPGGWKARGSFGMEREKSGPAGPPYQALGKAHVSLVLDMEKKSTPNAQGRVLTKICQSLRRAGSNEPSENHCPCESGKWRAKGPI